jgi:NADH-quinone oxidoreductase subunit M
MYQKVFYGQIHHQENKTLRDIDGRERISLVPLVIMAVIMGVVSPYWMKAIDPAVAGAMPKVAANTPTRNQSQVKSCDGPCTNKGQQNIAVATGGEK